MEMGFIMGLLTPKRERSMDLGDGATGSTSKNSSKKSQRVGLTRWGIEKDFQERCIMMDFSTLETGTTAFKRPTLIKLLTPNLKQEAVHPTKGHPKMMDKISFD